MTHSVGEKYPGRPICTRFFVSVQSVTYGTHQADSKDAHILIHEIKYKECLQTAWEVLTNTVHMPHSSKAPNS